MAGACATSSCALAAVSASHDPTRFATSVAAFADIRRGRRFIGAFAYDHVLRIASAARADDPFGYRSEFLQLVRAAKTASTMPSSRQ